MRLSWWFVYTLGVVCFVGGFTVPLLRSDRSRRLTLATALDGGGPRAAGVSVAGFALLMTVAGMATEGIPASVAVTGSAIAAGVLVASLVVWRHNARLDRIDGVEPDC